jgi:hypothetical protein
MGRPSNVAEAANRPESRVGYRLPNVYSYECFSPKPIELDIKEGTNDSANFIYTDPVKATQQDQKAEFH